MKKLALPPILGLALAALSGLLLPAPAFADAPAAAPAAAPVMLSVDQAHSTVTYHLVHKLHKFDGVSRKVEGRARILPSGLAQLQVRAPVQSFDSGNVNRDEHMKEVVEAARYPYVELIAVVDGLPSPTTFPTTIQKTARGELTFHGVKQPVQVPVKITWESNGRIHAVSSITVSLDSFKIERPSLLFVKIEDAMKVDADLIFKK